MPLLERKPGGSGLGLEDAEELRAVELEKLDGVCLALPSSALAEGSLPDTPMDQAILHNYNSRRSGDSNIVFKPGWFINDFTVWRASVHGSPWRYGQFVPVLFVCPGMVHQRVFRGIATVDVAPTLRSPITSTPGSCSKSSRTLSGLRFHISATSMTA